ncbi:MAG TPA: hypothetical protein VHU83_22105 [Bryobacteraceae bacterium]|nr:hypothetical protein [Bryobacteraceae bacterium]
MLQDKAQTVAIDRSFDAHSGSADFDVDRTRAWPGGRLFRLGHLGDAHRHELRRWRTQIEQTFTQELAPVEDLVRVHAVTARNDRN